MCCQVSESLIINVVCATSKGTNCDSKREAIKQHASDARQSVARRGGQRSGRCTRRVFDVRAYLIRGLVFRQSSRPKELGRRSDQPKLSPFRSSVRRSSWATSAGSGEVSEMCCYWRGVTCIPCPDGSRRACCSRRDSAMFTASAACSRCACFSAIPSSIRCPFTHDSQQAARADGPRSLL